MDYDTFGTALDSVLILAAALLCGLHLWFSAAMASVQKLGGQMSTLAEEHPPMQYYLKQKNRLRITAVAEVISFTALLTLAAYLLIFAKGWAHHWNIWLTLLLPAGVSLTAALLLDGCARGLGRKQAELVAGKSLGLVKLVAVLSLPVYGIYEGMDCLAGGKRPAKERVTEEDILHLVNAGNENGVIEEQQREMINNIFEFDDIPISDVMTHRKELVAIDVEMAIADVVKLAQDEKYSRMPVYQDNIDNIIGVLNAKDLLGLIGRQDISGYGVRYFMREALFVPETAKCDDVLSEMSRQKAQMAIVVDEYGGTAGVVCMEDILEEIVGNIQDEYDEEEAEVHRVTDSLYLINGHADPEETLPLLGHELPADMEFDTMSGFVVDLLGYIPEARENPSVYGAEHGRKLDLANQGGDSAGANGGRTAGNQIRQNACGTIAFRGRFLVAFQIVDEGLQVQDLFGRQTAYVQRLSVFQPEQIIGTDRKRLGNPNQHVDRRHDVVVFPVADALLRDIQAFAEFHLVDAQRMTELSDAFVKHDNTS